MVIFQRRLRLFVEFTLIICILLSFTGCIKSYIGGKKGMPFPSLTRDEFTKTEIINVAIYGAIGDGISDDSSPISQAISNADDNVVFFPSGTYRVSNNITVPSNVKLWFANGAKLDIDSGEVVAINGKLDSGPHQIFSGLGTVSIAKGACEYLMPQWWGAAGNGINDDTSAIQKAINTAAGEVGCVYIPSGTYKITDTLVIGQGTHLFGAGKTATEILASGGIDAIKVAVTVSGFIYEGTKISNLRIYSDTTPITGTAIEVYGERSCDIENVWIGAWYPSPGGGWGYGFDRGIDVNTNPAYYVTIRGCSLFRNNYGIYLRSGANLTKILDNEIWYDDYGVYTEGPGTIVTNNSIEGFTIAGIYSASVENVFKDNWIEATGLPSVILAVGARRNVIEGNLSTTGYSAQDDVINNSGYEYHKINSNQIPIGMHHMEGAGTTGDQFGLAGLIKSDYRSAGYFATDMILEATQQNLKLKARNRGNAVEMQSSTEVNQAKFGTPAGGFGYKPQNYALNPEDIAQWTDDTVTETSNAALAPNGEATATKLVGATASSAIWDSQFEFASVGDVINFSVWLKSDRKHIGKIGISCDSNGVATKYIDIGTEWQRYNVTWIVETACTWVYPTIYPGADYAVYAWGAQLAKYSAVIGTDDSDVDDKTGKIIDSGTDFQASGIDVGGMVVVKAVEPDTGASVGEITAIHTTLTFTGGTDEAPSVGETITGTTSSGMAIVVEVVLSSGDWATDDAAGYIEISDQTGVLTTEEITWDGGSATVTAVNQNCVLVTTLSASYGTKDDCDNGDTYYVCNSFASSMIPYVKSGTSTSSGIATPSITTNGIESTGNIVSSGGILSGGYYYANPLSNSFWVGDKSVVVVNPDEARIFFYDTSTPNGSVVHIYNISPLYSVSDGVVTIGPNEMAIAEKINNSWSYPFIGQNRLRTNSTPTFAGVTATSGRINAKTINGSVYALTYSSTISCDMNNGNVFTLTTTGDCAIDASNGVAGQKATFIISDDETGGHIVIFGTGFKPNGTLAGTASKTSVVEFVYDGTNWYEVSRTMGL